MHQKPKVLVIVGPTASGKTSLSIALAKRFQGEVISADSRQVYRRLDIGTEKITERDMQDIPHHLIDVADVDAVYTAVDFAKAGQEAIQAITTRHHLPIVAGGTFFYVDALLGRTVVPEAPPNPELRAELEALSLEALQSRLLALDPRRAATVEQSNPRRLMRSIEIAEALGYVPELEQRESPYDVLTLGIEVDRAVLRARLRSRAQSALERGLIEETKTLLDSGVSRERLSEIGLEYRIIMEYIDGVLTDEQLIQKLEEKNWQYAKRQRTWLKRDESIVWIDPTNADHITSIVEKWLTT